MQAFVYEFYLVLQQLGFGNAWAGLKDPRAKLKQDSLSAGLLSDLVHLQKKGVKANGHNAMLVSVDSEPYAFVEWVFVKLLENLGYHVVILSGKASIHEPWIDLNPDTDLILWNKYLRAGSFLEVVEAIKGINSFDEYLDFNYMGIRAGRNAAATMMRSLRIGTISMDDKPVRSIATRYLLEAVSCIKAAKKIQNEWTPAVSLFVDKGYLPQGPLFETAIHQGTDVMTWNVSHRPDSLVFKRYDKDSCDEHYLSLSDKSWDSILEEAWSVDKAKDVRDEVDHCYLDGSWYAEVGTQLGTRDVTRGEFCERLNLDTSKKIACIFSHIVWDGTFFWGTDIYQDYEEWLIETVKAAAKNTNVQWLIKFHPANRVKNARDKFEGVPVEIRLVEKLFDELPAHFHYIYPDSAISSKTVLDNIDYCLTVRGTVGIESALRGVPVLTAGTGRYHGKGFTLDAMDANEYEQKIAEIHKISPLSDEQRNLALRFAYAEFIQRPLKCEIFRLHYATDSKASASPELLIKDVLAWDKAREYVALKNWILKKDSMEWLAS